MTARTIILYVIFICTICTSSCGRRQTNRSASMVESSATFQKLVDDYNAAAKRKDGETIVNLVSPSTIEQYERERLHALNSDEKTVKNLPMSVRLFVLILRHDPEGGLDYLMKHDGKKILQDAVKAGAIRPNRVKVGKVEVEGNYAIAEGIERGRVIKNAWGFAKVDGQWKLDLGPTKKWADKVLQQIAQRSGVSENELLFATISKMFNRKVTDEIWQPLSK